MLNLSHIDLFYDSETRPSFATVFVIASLPISSIFPVPSSSLSFAGFSLSLSQWSQILAAPLRRDFVAAVSIEDLYDPDQCRLPTVTRAVSELTYPEM